LDQAPFSLYNAGMDTGIVIREVKTDDINSVVELHKKVVGLENSKFYPTEIINEWLSQISHENVFQQLSITDTPWYLIEVNKKIVGFSQFSTADKCLYQINIDPNYLGNGYGKKLYSFIEEKFRDSKADRIELWSTINAKEFYEKLGYKVIKKIKTKLINEEMDEYLMEKKLLQ
jgi:ribosomal protein S18 acetylase RimI-like enzyme